MAMLNKQIILHRKREADAVAELSEVQDELNSERTAHLSTVQSMREMAESREKGSKEWKVTIYFIKI